MASLLTFLLAGAVFFLFARNTYGQNGTLYFSPSSGQQLAGETFSVALRVNTGGVAINAAEGSVVFDTAKVNVQSVSKSGSIFSLWTTEPIFSNAEGTINFAGGLPNPGYSGSSGLVLTITFKAKTATTVRGYTDIVLVSGAILANDGEGTNILSSLGKYTAYIGPSGVYEGPIPLSPTPSPALIFSTGPVIKSSTHPDQDKWYSNKNPAFYWALPSEVKEVKLVLSKKAKSTPQIRYSPPISGKTLENLEDGVWYLHAQFCNSSACGPVGTFEFKIDTKPPDPFSLIRIDEDDATNPQPMLMFESSDDLSGLDRYEMKIGEGDWFAVSPDLAGKLYQLPLQLPGTREIWVKAIDKAGNSVSANTKIVVKSIQKPTLEVATPKIKTGETAIIRGRGETEIVLNVLKLENIWHFGLGALGFRKETREKLDRTVEAAVDENGNFEAKIDGLKSGAYIIRAYSKDERGAVSNISDDVSLEVEGKLFFTQFAEWVPNAILRGFNALMNFIINGWLIIIVGILVMGLIRLLVKEVIPAVVREIKKFTYIFNEYKASGQLRKEDKKMQFEIRELYKDIEKELDLLKKIGRHRGFRSDEKYTKKKLEKYLGLLKSLK